MVGLTKYQASATSDSLCQNGSHLCLKDKGGKNDVNFISCQKQRLITISLVWRDRDIYKLLFDTYSYTVHATTKQKRALTQTMLCLLLPMLCCNGRLTTKKKKLGNIGNLLAKFML